ncbi:unnamed protein product, partial [marine sediment metagenome]
MKKTSEQSGQAQPDPERRIDRGGGRPPREDQGT